MTGELKRLEQETEILEHLNILAEQIKQEHQACFGAMRQGVEHALNVGELLLQARSFVFHGEWEKWVINNCYFTPRMARNYMKVARYRRQLKTETISEIDKAGALADSNVKFHEELVREYGATIRKKPEHKTRQTQERELSQEGQNLISSVEEVKKDLKDFLVLIRKEGVSLQEMQYVGNTLMKFIRGVYRVVINLEKASMVVERNETQEPEKNYVQKYHGAMKGFITAVSVMASRAEFSRFSHDMVLAIIDRHEDLRQELERLEDVLKKQLEPGEPG